MTLQITLTKQFITASPFYISSFDASFMAYGFSWCFCSKSDGTLYLSRFDYKSGGLILFKFLNTTRTSNLNYSLCVKQGFLTYFASGYFIKLLLPLGNYVNQINDIMVSVSPFVPISSGYFDSFNGIAEEILDNGGGTYVHNAYFMYSSNPTLQYQTVTDSTLPYYVSYPKRINDYLRSIGANGLLNFFDGGTYATVFNGQDTTNLCNNFSSDIILPSSYSSISFSGGLISAGLGANTVIFTNGKLITPQYTLYCDGIQTNNCTAIIDSGIWATLIDNTDFYSYSTNQPVPFNFNLQNSNIVINHNRPISTTGHFLT